MSKPHKVRGECGWRLEHWPTFLPRKRADVTLQKYIAESDAELLGLFISCWRRNRFRGLCCRHGPMASWCLPSCASVHRTRRTPSSHIPGPGPQGFLRFALFKLAGWLHGVAYKTALKARQRALHRLEVEKVPPRSPAEQSPDSTSTGIEELLDQKSPDCPSATGCRSSTATWKGG